MSSTEGAAVGRADRPSRHQTFLAYSRYRFLGLAGLLSVAAIALYVVDRPYGGNRYGGTWVGYILGTAGALLILWLTWYGIHKRRYIAIGHPLAGLLSAHVYFGLALLIVATLHTGFHFGWNIHTLAYVLMCLVIASGLFGVYCYARYPRLMTENRGGMSLQQMLGSISILDQQLRERAMPLDEQSAAVIDRAIETSMIGGSVWRQLSGNYRDCPTGAAIGYFKAAVNQPLDLPDDPHSQVFVLPIEAQILVLLNEKSSLLNRARRDVTYQAMLEVWLYLHVPVSFMLLAALLAHVVSVFFLW